jgi:glycosyltransferase involved in cell wall biosynthesis
VTGRIRFVAYQYRFTVFTPTYNRAHLLPRLYESLQQQSNRDFEWLIVDDGSTDGTQAQVEQWQKEDRLPLRYIWQPNAGKSMAFNRGVQEARGELFLAIDSDDALLPESLAIFSKHWDAIQALGPTESARFSGVTGQCQDQFGNLYGDLFPQDMIDSDINEIRYKFKTQGEKKGFTRTDIHKTFPFPTLDNNTFVPESVVWNAIGHKYTTRFVNDIVRVYWSHDEERLTTGGVSVASSPGHALWHRDVLNTNLKYFRYSPASLLKSGIHYTRFSLHAGDSFAAQWRHLRGIAARGLWMSTVAVGWLVYRKDRRAGLKH